MVQLKTCHIYLTQTKHEYSIPGFVYHTAAQIAKAKDVSVDVILEANRENVAKVYNIPLPATEDDDDLDQGINIFDPTIVHSCNNAIRIEKNLVEKSTSPDREGREKLISIDDCIHTCSAVIRLDK